MEKLLIVDGSNLLFQMFYGMPARIVNGQGRPVQGTVGFVGALLKIIRMVNPTHVAVLFDGEYESRRREVDEDYKANRVDYSTMPEVDTPFSQLPDIFSALDYLGICYSETSVCEADDWIAGYAITYGETMDVVIASQDSDFFQLITDRVQVLRYRGKNSVICDPVYIREKLGIGPGQYAAYKSLTGDAADNIRGVEKIGPKTAAALLNQFGNLDALLMETDRIPKPSVRASVEKSRDRIRKNYSLICLQSGTELPFAMEDMVFHDSGLSSTQVLKTVAVL